MESIKRVRRPGLEPGFRRWQRLVITTTLSAQPITALTMVGIQRIKVYRHSDAGDKTGLLRGPGHYLQYLPAGLLSFNLLKANPTP